MKTFLGVEKYKRICKDLRPLGVKAQSGQMSINTITKYTQRNV